MDTTHERHSTDDRTIIELEIQGMTCASCSARIEKVLGRQPGVAEAAVNLATEKARVVVDPDACGPNELVAAVEKAGYGARERSAGHRGGHDAGGHDAGGHDAGHGARAAHAEDHSEHLLHDRSPAYYMKRFIAAAVFTIPLVVISMSRLNHADWAMWVAMGLATPVQWFSGWPFLRSAFKQARHLSSNMDTLVAVGTLSAYLYSSWATLTNNHDHYFETGAVVITLLLLGKYFEGLSKGRASEAIKALLERGAKEARVMRDGIQVTIPAEQVVVGDLLVIRPGETIAADGIVREGTSAVDESMITGESVPLDKQPGDGVLGGTVNANGSLTVEATRVGADSAIARIARLVEEAQSGKAPIQRMADRVSAIFVPAVLLLAAGTFVGWLVTGHTSGDALIATVSVLIIACPCAMGLATPVAIMVGTGRGAQLGIVIRGGEVLERSRDIDVVVLDKTGTVTKGEMALTDVVVDVWNDGSVGDDELLARTASVEALSEHPIAAAVVAGAEERGVTVPKATNFQAFGGRGARADVDGKTVTVGRPALLGEHGLMGCAELDERREALEAEGKTVFVAGWDGRVRGLLAVADEVKPSAAAAVAALKSQGLEVVLLTGDNATTAEAIATQVGIDTVIADVRPEQKVEQITARRSEGKRVAMVGDGINDAPALATADLGIAMGTGTDVAIEASDITLVGQDLLAVPTAIGLARRTYRTIVQNLFWAFGYNVVLLPLAVAGKVNPMLAGFAMAFSSVSVVLNALRLKRVQPAS